MEIRRSFLLLFFCFSAALAQRMIGYYSIANGYAGKAGCPAILTPDDIPADLYTHMIFAFLPIGGDGQVSPLTDNATITAIQQLMAMKDRNSNLKVIISYGGWAMNMSLYSNAVSTAQGRTTLVNSAMSFARQWGFDGMDFDWEYPGAPERGGAPEDPQNLASFIHQLRGAVDAESVPSGKEKLTISLPLPGGSFYGVEYIMTQMIYDLDFANIMAYNLHGPWEPVVYCSANFYDGTPASSPYHGYSINDAITYFLTQNGSNLPADKFNLGVTFAGGDYTLANGVTNYAPGAAAVGAGNGGPCTQEPGYMAYFEVENMINSGTLKASDITFDPVGYCKYFVYDNNQWVGYDDADTLSKKVGLVEQKGLGGISIWAMYAESASGPVLQTAIHTALVKGAQNNENNSAGQMSVSFLGLILLITMLMQL